MASQPPTELPPIPAQPSDPGVPQPGFSPPTPDTDIPDPGAPASDPAPIQPEA